MDSAIHQLSQSGSKGWLAAALLLLSIGLGIVYMNPAIALLGAMGLRLATQVNPVPASGTWGKLSLQTAIVLLGLTMGMDQMLAVSAEYGWTVAAYVLGTLLLGGGLAWALRARNVETDLITSGTAICGGTAIATLAPIMGAQPQQFGVATALVFLLNAVALLVFPFIGHWLGLSQEVFGAWVALAVHDTSSVVATAALYGEQAQQVATTVKLGRTLWLIPLAFVASIMFHKGDAKLRVPIFVLLFVLAAGVASLVNMPGEVLQVIRVTSKVLLVLALAMIGLDISRETLRGLSGKSVAFGIGLWILVIPLSLGLILLIQ